MANKKKSPMFHAPKKTGEVRPVPKSRPMICVSIVSLVLLLALTAFAIYAAATTQAQDVMLAPQFYMPAGLLYLFLPLIGWLIAAGFRLAVRLIPLEMWRLPARVKEATIKTRGKYLKWATLLIELETVLVFGYITFSIYRGITPGDVPILIWVAAVAATIIYFGRYVLIAADREK